MITKHLRNLKGFTPIESMSTNIRKSDLGKASQRAPPIKRFPEPAGDARQHQLPSELLWAINGGHLACHSDVPMFPRPTWNSLELSKAMDKLMLIGMMSSPSTYLQM